MNLHEHAVANESKYEWVSFKTNKNLVRLIRRAAAASGCGLHKWLADAANEKIAREKAETNGAEE